LAQAHETGSGEKESNRKPRKKKPANLIRRLTAGALRPASNSNNDDGHSEDAVPTNGGGSDEDSGNLRGSDGDISGDEDGGSFVPPSDLQGGVSIIPRAKRRGKSAIPDSSLHGSSHGRAEVNKWPSPETKKQNKKPVPNAPQQPVNAQSKEPNGKAYWRDSGFVGYAYLEDHVHNVTCKLCKKKLTRATDPFGRLFIVSLVNTTRPILDDDGNPTPARQKAYSQQFYHANCLRTLVVKKGVKSLFAAPSGFKDGKVDRQRADDAARAIGVKYNPVLEQNH
jgi:hypothetical protein